MLPWQRNDETGQRGVVSVVVVGVDGPSGWPGPGLWCTGSVSPLVSADLWFAGGGGGRTDKVVVVVVTSGVAVAVWPTV